METSVSTTNAGLKYGLYTGLALIAFDLLLYVAGMKDPADPSPIQYLGFVVFIVGVVLGIKYYKDSNEGLLTYGQGLGSGTVTALVAGIIVAVYVILFFTVLDPGMIEEIREAQKVAAMEANPSMTDEQWESAAGIMNAMTSPTAMGIMSIIIYVIVGFITSLIAGAFMKNEQNA
jgi:hypothetical protein